MGYQNYINYRDAIARGLPNHSVIHKFGKWDVTTTVATVWDGAATYSYPPTNTVMRLVSSAAADATAGTGARECTIYGLDSNYAEITESVALAGIVPKTLTAAFLRVYRMIVHSCGTGGLNAGTLYLFDDAGTITAGTGVPTVTTTKFAQIGIGNNQTLMAIYTVPADKKGYLTKFYASSPKGKDANVRMYRRPFGECFQLKEQINVYENASEFHHDVPVQIESRTDIEIRASSPSVTGTIVCAGFDLYMTEGED